MADRVCQRLQRPAHRLRRIGAEGGDGQLRTRRHPPDDREQVWEAVQSAVDAGEPFQIEYRIRTAEGEERLVWERGQEIETVVGESLLEGVVWDIAEHTYAPQRVDGTTVREH